MRERGWEGPRRGRRRRTTIADPAAPRRADLVQSRFSPGRPDAVWAADYTYVATWSGTVYIAFVLDAHSRRILGWRAATSMRTVLVLDALEQAIWTRGREGVTDLSGLVCHNDSRSVHVHCVRRAARRRRRGTQRRHRRRRAGQRSGRDPPRAGQDRADPPPR